MVTEADREKAIAIQMAQWGIAFDELTDRIAEALAAEREAARAPFLALADELRREASFGDGTQRAYEMDELADRIRYANEDAE